jgi:hypothetical protein
MLRSPTHTQNKVNLAHDKTASICIYMAWLKTLTTADALYRLPNATPARSTAVAGNKGRIITLVSQYSFAMPDLVRLVRTFLQGRPGTYRAFRALFCTGTHMGAGQK